MADITAETNVTLLSLSATAVFRLCRKSPEVALPVILKVARLVGYPLRETSNLLEEANNTKRDPLEFLIALYQRVSKDVDI